MIFRIAVLIGLLTFPLHKIFAQIYIYGDRNIYYQNSNNGLKLKQKDDFKFTYGSSIDNFDVFINSKLAYSFKENFAAKLMFSNSHRVHKQNIETRERKLHYQNIALEAGVYKFFPIYKDAAVWNKREKPRKYKFDYAYKPGILFDANLGYNFGFVKKRFYRSLNNYSYKTGKLNFKGLYLDLGFQLSTQFFVNIDYNIKYTFLNYKKFKGSFDYGSDFQNTIDFLYDNDPFFITEHITKIHLGGKFARPYICFSTVKKPKKINENSDYFDNNFSTNAVFAGIIIDVDDFLLAITGKRNLLNKVEN